MKESVNVTVKCLRSLPLAATYAQLRGLVEHVPWTRLRTDSPIAPSAISPRLDCFQVLGIKRYTLAVAGHLW
jgi:hypothetical protein